MLKRIALLAVLATPLAAQSFQPGRLPASSRDSFEVVYQGRPIGHFILSQARTGDNVTMVTTANLEAMGMIALDTVVFNATSLAPVLFMFSQTMGPMSSGGRVTVTNGKATGSVSQPSPGGMQNLAIDAAIPPGMPPEGADALLIPTLDFSDGLTFSFQLFNGKTGKPISYALKVMGKETVTVPAGTFEAWKMEIVGEETANMWVTTAEPRRIVLMRLEGPQLEMKRASK